MSDQATVDDLISLIECGDSDAARLMLAAHPQLA